MYWTTDTHFTKRQMNAKPRKHHKQNLIKLKDSKPEVLTAVTTKISLLEYGAM
jgi:hypothetical protein